MRRLTADELLSRLQRLRLVQGPLAGVSSVPFRRLVWRYSEPAWVYSEMISCQTILSGSDQIRERYCAVAEDEGPLCMQIATRCADECARACAVLNRLPISMIDLNVGCPVKKIRRRGQGSFLLSRSDELRSVIAAMRRYSDVPISVKIRVDGESGDGFNEGVLAVLDQEPPDFLVVHGRHYQDGYDVSCRHAEIARFARGLSVPVIGNGDIAALQGLQSMLAAGCVGGMVARASVGAPWLIGQIQAEMGLDVPMSVMDQAQSWQVFCAHLRDLQVLLGGERFALAHAQGLIRYYAKRNGFVPEVLARVRAARTLAQVYASYVTNS